MTSSAIVSQVPTSAGGGKLSHESTGLTISTTEEDNLVDDDWLDIPQCSFSLVCSLVTGVMSSLTIKLPIFSHLLRLEREGQQSTQAKPFFTHWHRIHLLFFIQEQQPDWECDQEPILVAILNQSNNMDRVINNNIIVQQGDNISKLL